MTIPPLRVLRKKELNRDLLIPGWKSEGKIRNIVGNLIEADLPASRMGTVTEIAASGAEEGIYAEVVGFRKNKTLLLPYSGLHGIKAGSVIREHSFSGHIQVSHGLLGRVLDPFLRPLAGQSVQRGQPALVALDPPALNPMRRKRICSPLNLGIRAIDGLLTMGFGQRLGIMAGSGVGKSVLLGMIARGSECDINVIGLIGERGREVREFIERELGPEGLKKSVVIVATGDQSPLMRIRAAKSVFSVAEYFSSKGKNVMLMMDSLTRVAHAQREIGLAVGEAPTSKGYTPSVFSLLPRLLERSGPQQESMGSISGLYTVLADGDDFNDPIVDAARSILDGHIQLSRSLAAQGHFPAIDISHSISRVMNDITDKDHLDLARYIKSLISCWEEHLDFIQLGTYQEGLNPLLDQAVKAMPHIKNYLRQTMETLSHRHEVISGLHSILKQVQGNIQTAAGQANG